MKDGRLGHVVEQGIGRYAIRYVAPGQDKSQRAAIVVGQGVDLRGPSALGLADGLVTLPPFAPAAQRWALTAETLSEEWILDNLLQLSSINVLPMQFAHYMAVIFYYFRKRIPYKFLYCNTRDKILYKCQYAYNYT